MWLQFLRWDVLSCGGWPLGRGSMNEHSSCWELDRHCSIQAEAAEGHRLKESHYIHTYIHCCCHFLPLNMRQQGRGLKMSFNSQIGNAVLGGTGFDSRPNYRLSWSFAYKLQLNSGAPYNRPQYTLSRPEYRLHLFTVIFPSNLMLYNVCG